MDTFGLISPLEGSNAQGILKNSSTCFTQHTEWDQLNISCYAHDNAHAKYDAAY